MLFNLSSTTFTIYFDGNLEGLGDNYRLQLVSTYSGKNILNDVEPYFDLQDVLFNDRFSRFVCDFTDADIQTMEVEGYYTWIVENEFDGEWTEMGRGLCKVINASQSLGQNTIVPYNSGNDTNESIVYFE